MRLLDTTATSALLVLLSLPVAAASLSDAMVSAYTSNPRLESGRAQLLRTDELVPQAIAGYRPQIFGSSSLEGVDINRDGTDGSDSRTTSSVGISLQQNLYSGGGTNATVSRAENLVLSERASLRSLEQAVLFDAVRAYTAVWRDRSVLQLALNNEQRLMRQLQATRDRFEVGEVARTDVAQAEARLARARADVEDAKANLGTSDASYRRVVGVMPEQLEDPKPLRDLPATVDAARALATANPDIVAANYSLFAARDDVDVEFADLLPSVDLSADFSYVNEPTQAVDWQRAASLGVTLTVPLYQGGGEYAQVRSSRYNVRQQVNNLEEQHRAVQEAVASSYDQLLAATAAIQSFREEVRANQIALEGVQEEALVGARTTLDVLDAEQELFTSQINLVQAIAIEVVATYALKQAVGELNVRDLNLPVEPFDPLLGYQRIRTRLFGIEIEPLSP